MKVSLFFDNYQPFHEDKDPGQIIFGLIENGFKADLITLEKKELLNYHPFFPLIKVAKKEEFYSNNFWSKLDSDLIIFYSWLSKVYTPIVKVIKKRGKKVLIKADNDGCIGYPLLTHQLKTPLFKGSFVKNVFHQIEWRLHLKSFYSKNIEQIELSDGVIIESPDALSNLNYFLANWGRKDLIQKNYFVPNPVTPEFINCKVGKKENIVIAVGRWEDEVPKNTKLMVETLTEFLEYKKNYRAVIVGSGKKNVEKFLRGVSKEIKNRIEITGPKEHGKIKDFLLPAKIFFMPSRWESFGIAGAEALCCGCSLAGTPLEALRYLSMQGFSGTTASSFKKEAVLAALIQESIKWERNYYFPEKISEFWKAKLDRKKIAKEISEIIKGDPSTALRD